MEVPEYKELYRKYLQEVVTNYVENSIFEQTLTKLDTLISNYVKNDTTAFYTYEQYKNSLTSLLQFVKDRSTSIKAQLSGEQPSNSYGSISTAVNLQTLGGMGGMGGMGTIGAMGGIEGNGARRARPGGLDEPDRSIQQDGQADGNMPQMNINENEQGSSIDSVMLDREIMRKVIDILMGSNSGELTEEQLTQLKELGLTDAQIEEMKNMAARGAQGTIERRIPEMNAGILPFNANRQNTIATQGLDSNSMELYLAILLYLLFLVGGIVFVWKFKRKKCR